MRKNPPFVAVEIPQFTGLRLTDPAVDALEKVLAEVATVLASDYPALISRNRTALDRMISKSLKELAAALEGRPSFAGAHKDFIAAAACMLAAARLADMEQSDTKVLRNAVEVTELAHA